MLNIKNVSKSYGPLTVLKDVNMSLDDGGIYCLMAPSGAGKTTLIRLILGLERPDEGEIETDFGDHPYSVVFQEDRLCENFSPLENIALVCKKGSREDELIKEISRLLPKECTDREVRTLSGGMRRRVSVLRAMLAPSQAVLMDEPFTGLDEDMRRTVIDYVLEKRGSRLLFVTTHQEEDVKLLGAQLLRPRGFMTSPSF